jgi:hypothetical protein
MPTCALPTRLARIQGLASQVSPGARAMAAVATAVLLANLPYLVGLFDPNPLGPRSGLVTDVVAGPIRGQPTIDPNNGFVSQALGHRAVLDELHLQLPWWNPYEGSGTPLAGEMQSAALFPPTLLTLLSDGQIYEHMLLEMIAGVATYLLLRRIAASWWASAAGAIAFALNGTFAWFSHATVNPVAFLPLLLLGIELAYAAASAGRRGGWWLIAIAGALSFYAGFPEVAYIDTLLAACWFTWRCGCSGREHLRSFAAKAAAGAIVGVALSAPLLIASILATSLLLLALVGALSTGRRRLRLILVVWIMLVLSRLYGEPPFLDAVLGILPGMSRVAFFRCATASLELPVAILAALGLDELRTASAMRGRLLGAILASLAAVLAAAIAARPLARQLGSTFTIDRTSRGPWPGAGP